MEFLIRSAAFLSVLVVACGLSWIITRVSYRKLGMGYGILWGWAAASCGILLLMIMTVQAPRIYALPALIGIEQSALLALLCSLIIAITVGRRESRKLSAD